MIKFFFSQCPELLNEIKGLKESERRGLKSLEMNNDFSEAYNGNNYLRSIDQIEEEDYRVKDLAALLKKPRLQSLKFEKTLLVQNLFFFNKSIFCKSCFKTALLAGIRSLSKESPTIKALSGFP